MIELKQGQSTTIGILIADGYDMSNIDNVYLYINQTKFTPTIIDRMLRVEMSSKTTSVFIGTSTVRLIFDDKTFGRREYVLENIVWEATKARVYDDSVDFGYTVTYPITISETAIEAGDVMYDYVKGSAGSLSSVTASVDSNVGTPEVTVTYDGENADFAFKNLKGDKGDKGDKGEQGENGDDAVLPANIVIDPNYVHTDNNYTDEDKAKVAGAIQTETDPTVPAWAKEPTKPTYTASDVGASKTGHTHTEYSKEPLSITYADLYNLTQTSGLSVGQRYIINDYQTVHEQPNTGEMTWDGANYITQPNVIYTAPVEQLLVEALSTSKLANECKSLEFPQDIIYYNINNDQSVVPGCSKGYIYRRIDTELNNDIDMDFRKAKIRAYLHNGSYRLCYWVQNPFEYDGSLYFGYGFKIDHSTNILYYQAVDFNSTNKIDTIIFKDATDYKSQNITNNKFYGNSSNLIGDRNSLFVGNYFYSNTIGNGFYYNTIGNNFYNNTIGDGFYNNTIGRDFNSNTIGNYFYDNTIGINFSSNTIGNDFNSNTIGYNFISNTIGNYFSYNTIEFSFYSNTIGTGFGNNTIGDGFGNNTIGYDFNYNTIGYDFNYNTIGDYFNSNTIGNSFHKNNIESNVSSINFVSPLSVYVYLDYTKYIFKTSIGTTKLRYYDGNNTLQITNANA